MTEEKNELVIDDGRIEAVQEHLSPEELYRDLISRVQKYHPSDDVAPQEIAERELSGKKQAHAVVTRSHPAEGTIRACLPDNARKSADQFAEDLG